MPRLIRMSSSADPNGHFNNTYNAEITLPPNSQLCLQNITAKLPPVMEVTAANSEIQFTVAGAGNIEGSYNLDGPRIVNIPTGIYNDSSEASSYIDFANVVESTLNSGLSSLRSNSTSTPPAEAGAIGFTAGRRGSVKDIGGEWSIKEDQQKNMTISYKQQTEAMLVHETQTAPNANLSESLTNGFALKNYVSIDATALSAATNPSWTLPTGDSTAADIFGKASTATLVDGSNTRFLFGSKPMARGGGSFGVRILEALNGTGGSLDGTNPLAGLVIGLCQGDPEAYVDKTTDVPTFDITKLKYGIHIRGTSNNISVVRDGVSTLSPSLPSPFNLNMPLNNTQAQQHPAPATGQTCDYLKLPIVEFGWDMGRLELRIYQNQASLGVLERYIVYQFDVDNNSAKGKDFINVMAQQNLHPVIIFRNGRTTVGEYGGHAISNVYFSASPHDTTALSHRGLGARRQTGNPTLQETAWIRFRPGVSNFFGFLSSDLPVSAPTLGQSYTNDLVFVGGTLTTSGGFPENFVVELLTIPLSSYDGKELLTDGTSYGSGQIQSILATIPKDRDSAGVLRYESGDPYFIDLDNDKPILLRDIFLRLLTHDLTPQPLSGNSCITLLTRVRQ